MKIQKISELKKKLRNILIKYLLNKLSDSFYLKKKISARKLFSEGQMQDLISAKFALENFSKPNTVFLDATFHLPNSRKGH